MQVILNLSIDSSNAAFDAPEVEVARILRDAAKKIEAGRTVCGLKDFNGNEKDEDDENDE